MFSQGLVPAKSTVVLGVARDAQAFKELMDPFTVSRYSCIHLTFLGIPRRRSPKEGVSRVRRRVQSSPWSQVEASYFYLIICGDIIYLRWLVMNFGYCGFASV